MPATKLLRIINAVASRVQEIQIANGYYTDAGLDVRLDEREPHEDDVPCASVWLDPGEIGQTQNSRQRVTQSINVVAYGVLTGRGAQVDGAELLADIQRAVETDDRTLTGLLLDSVYGIQAQTFEVIMPESGVNAVAARITYAIPHVRKSGDPEII